MPVDADLNVTSVWQSAENFSVTKDPGTLQPAYNIANLSLTLTPQRDKRLNVTLFCNNLLDKHYAVNLNNVRGNYTLPAGGTAYAQELPRDFDRETARYPLRVHIGGFGSRYVKVADLLRPDTEFRDAFLKEFEARVSLFR